MSALGSQSAVYLPSCWRSPQRSLPRLFSDWGGMPNPPQSGASPPVKTLVRAMWRGSPRGGRRRTREEESADTQCPALSQSGGLLAQLLGDLSVVPPRLFPIKGGNESASIQGFASASRYAMRRAFAGGGRRRTRVKSADTSVSARSKPICGLLPSCWRSPRERPRPASPGGIPDFHSIEEQSAS